MARYVVVSLFVVTIAVLSAESRWAGDPKSSNGYKSSVEITKASQAKSENFTLEKLNIWGSSSAANLTRVKRAVQAVNPATGLTETERKSILEIGGPKGAGTLSAKISAWVNERTHILSHPSSFSNKPGRAERGEHVINMGVTTLYENILDMFLTSKRIEFDPYGKPYVDYLWRYYRTSMSQGVKRNLNNIDTFLKVKIPESVHYIDTNTKIYGNSIRLLKDLALKHMVEYFDQISRNPNTKWAPALEQAIQLIVANEIYVDIEALEKWNEVKKDQSNRKQMYKDALSTVETMFLSLKSNTEAWVRILKNAPNRLIRGGSRRA